MPHHFPGLFEENCPTATMTHEEEMRSSFERFHEANPQVYRLFCRFADELIASGRRYYSSRAICSRIVWHVDVQTAGTKFKINNNHTAFYARLWMEDHPEYPDFFRTRKSAAEGA